MCSSDLGLDRRRGEHRLVVGVGRHAVQIEAHRLEAGRVGRIGVDRARHLVGGRELARQVGIVNIGRIALWREHRTLQRDQRGIGRLQTAVDLLVEHHVLLVVVQAKSGQQSQPVVDGLLKAESLDDLKTRYASAYKTFQSDKDSLALIEQAKNTRKAQLLEIKNAD